MNYEYTLSLDSDFSDRDECSILSILPSTSSQRPEPASSKVRLQNNKRSLLISCVRNCPHLYDVKDPSYKDMIKKAKTWTAISEVLGLSPMLCQRRWKSLREKYCSESKHFAETGHVSEKSKQFLKDLDFLSYKKNTGDLSRRTQTNTRTETPRNQEADRKIDELFLEVIAEKLQQYSRIQKDELQANILKIFADFGKR